jgi:hypothetical protein
MADDHEGKHVRAWAHDLRQGGTLGRDLAAAAGRLGTPIAVQAPDGRRHSWFVPVTVAKQLAGFFQFLPDGTLLRFSSFQRRVGDLTGCPAAADWLDRKRIQARAAVQCQADETSGTPLLTYDRTPDRLVWAVPLTKPGGAVRRVYVTGETVYAPPPAGATG